MSYVVPQVKVFQEFTSTPAAIANPLRAFIVGPNYFVQKYEDGEGLLGQYDPDADSVYSWPNRPAGAVVDNSFTQITVVDALLRYYENVAGSVVDEIRGIIDLPNRIRAEAVNFKDNPDDVLFPLDAALNDRDVAIGDIARVFANVSGATSEIWTRVTGIVADQSASVVAAATSDAGNQGLLNEGGSGADASGNAGLRSALTGSNFAGYDGLADGHAIETYTVEITTPSASGTGALAKVTSASGTDDATDLAIVASGQAIGSRGATFDWGGSGDWNLGDTFTVIVNQTYRAPTVTSGGTFDSNSDTTYILTVSKGGAAGTALISISTTNGLDVSGPHIVSEGGSIAIGTKGVTVIFDLFQGQSSSSGLAGSGESGDGLIKGEKWYVICTGRADTGYKTLVLADNLPLALQQRSGWDVGSSSSANFASDLNLQLFVAKTITLPRENFPDMPNVNWSQSATQVTLESGAKVYDSEFVDSLGNQVALTLDADSDGLYSIAWVTYRALQQTFTGDIGTITDIEQVDDVLGKISTDNPLALGVWYALRNANGVAVKYIAVATDDLTGYQDAMEKAIGRRDVYTIVPMTKNAVIQNAIAAHVDARSTSTEGQWRTAFFNGDSSATDALIDTTELYPIGGTTAYDSDDLLLTLEDDPAATGLQYTIAKWDVGAYPAGGGFVAMGVRAGDILRTNYVGDGFGGMSYDDYVVDAVISNQELRLVSGPSGAVTVAQKFSIHKSLTKDEEATVYGSKAATFANRRIYYVWPDKIEDAAGIQIDGIYACAAIAGLISGVVPQQGLTNVQVEGFSDVTRTTDYFSATQLNTMAGLGVWIIAEDPEDHQIFSRHEVSTDPTTLNTRELMVTKNVDSISFTFLAQLEPYIGRSNITPRFLTQLRRQVLGTVDFLKAQGSTPALGGQLITAEIVDLRQDEVNLDQVLVTLNITIPYPANVILLKLVV